MEYVWASLVISLLIGSQVLQVFGAPANWVGVGLVALWKWLYPASMDWQFVALLAGIALVGEITEFALQTWGAKKYGAGRAGNIGGIIGAIAGAIICAPFLLGFGALLGALGGAYLGCLIFEMPGKDFAQARHAALGAFWGKAFGMTFKMSLGAVIVVLGTPAIWP
ncbi:DUF456 domain-containing protein [Salidesulfovibrio onnuriiensis]|uniref:DUF456 domain-containing protein n=1 Tax=Salidesulfovibrio onnuriiensis TaxID=2583823 RepID=UPI0011C89224|nr:DUF456 domain-containing protein [Salidesulfovibrio onnuriiensis]